MRGRTPRLRQTLLILLIMLAVLVVGYGLSTPVWLCETQAVPGGPDVVTRACHNAPRSRALWTWLMRPARS